jgi:hypothetical protein
MPGKVNPVIPESVRQVAAQVIGNDAAVAIGGLSGELELNVMIPLMARNVLESQRLLAAVSDVFVDKCLVGTTATDQGPILVERSLMQVTALVPEIGYERSAALAKTAHKQGIDPARGRARRRRRRGAARPGARLHAHDAGRDALSEPDAISDLPVGRARRRPGARGGIVAATLLAYAFQLVGGRMLGPEGSRRCRSCGR